MVDRHLNNVITSFYLLIMASKEGERKDVTRSKLGHYKMKGIPDEQGADIKKGERKDYTEEKA